MQLVKLAIANVSSTVGATTANTEAILTLARAAAADDAWLIAFPEQVVGGYPAEDLVQWKAFVDAQQAALKRLAKETSTLRTILVVGVIVRVGGQLFNAAAVVHGGTILGFVPKEKLPTYNVFYEARTLSRGAPGIALEMDGVPFGDYIFRFDIGTLAVEVCEDAWSPDGPMRRRCYSGAELVVNLSASPYRVGVVATRREMLATRSADNQTPLLYANAVGGQDGLVFDGGGYVFQNGRPVARGAALPRGFATCTVDLDRTRPAARREHDLAHRRPRPFSGDRRPVPVAAQFECHDRRPRHLRYPVAAREELLPAANRRRHPSRRATSCWTICSKRWRSGSTTTSRSPAPSVASASRLSGGRDSLLACSSPGVQSSSKPAWMLARMSSPPRRRMLSAFYMPTPLLRRRDASGRRDDLPRARRPAHHLADRRRVRARSRGHRDDARRRGADGRSRCRTSRRGCAVSGCGTGPTRAGALFLQTGNMSEKAVGYTTIGGDLEGALSVIANVPKTVVDLPARVTCTSDSASEGIALVPADGRARAGRQPERARSELMPFPVLDACLHLYAGEKLVPGRGRRGAGRSISRTSSKPSLQAYARRFARLFTQSIYKWVQSPLALHVGKLDLDRERALQLPVVQRTEWAGGE